MKILFSFLISLLYLTSFSQTTPLSFSPLAGDFTAPNRGAQHWGTSDWGAFNATPTIPAGNTRPKNFYTRFNWQDIESNTVQGSYSFTVFDAFVNQAIDSGCMFTFGIMVECHACGPLGNIPIYVQNLMTAEGKPGPVVSGDVQPNYQSVQWVNRYSALLRAVANHIAVTSRNGRTYTSAFLGFDLRHFSEFGEGNGFPSPGTIPSSAQVTTQYLTQMVDTAIAIYPNVQLTIPMSYVAPNNDYTLSHGNTDAQSAYHVLTAFNNYGRIGWRRDNIGDDGYNAYLTGTTATFNGVPLLPLIMNCYQVAPIGGEPAQDYCGTSRCGSIYCDVHNENVLFHMSNFGNGNYPIATNANGPVTCSLNTPPVTSNGGDSLTSHMRAASAEQGYKISLDSGRMTTTILSGTPFNIKLYWRNSGLAPVYESWKVMYELRNGAGTVVWTGISRLNLKLFQPSATNTLSSDNFWMNNAIAPGTYTMNLIIRDPVGYKIPFQIANTGRLADGSYVIRAGIVITSTPTLDSLIFINIWGESNAAGNALNSAALPSELGVRNEVRINDHNSHAFVNLNISGNSQQDGFIEDGLHHGLTLSMANEVDSGHLPNPTFLVQDGVSGSYICQWNPLTELACRSVGGLWTNWELPFVSPAVTAMNAMGKPYRFYVWQSIGLNDEFGQGTTTDSFVSKMQQFRTNVRSIYSNPNIIFLGTNFNNPPQSTLPVSWDSVYRIRIPKQDPKYHEAPVLGATYVDAGSHFDYLGFKLIGKNIVDTMLALLITNAGGSGPSPPPPHQPPTAVITGPTTITLPTSSVTLSGVSSFPASGVIVSYLWTNVSGPNTAVITTPTASSTSFTSLLQGTYVFRLTVTDDSSATGTATWTVSVNSAPGNGLTVFTTQVPPSDKFNDGISIELGMKFRSSVAGFITGVRFFKVVGFTGTQTGELYTSAGTRLAQAIFTGETASGWQTVIFATPVPILANTTYVAAYYSSSGDYVESTPYFSTSVVNNPLTGLATGIDGSNGVFHKGAGPAFPNTTSSDPSPNYWVDIIFAAGSPPSPSLPCNCHPRYLIDRERVQNGF